MKGTNKKAKATASTGKSTKKSVAATVKKVARVKKAARVEAVAHVEIPAVSAPAVNDDATMQAADVVEVAELAPIAATMPMGASDDRIVLPARMEMASLDEAHQLLQSKYPPLSDKYVLDGGLLSVIDSAGIQMLISFIRSTTARGCKIEWDNYSVQVYQLASELGVANQLGD